MLQQLHMETKSQGSSLEKPIGIEAPASEHPNFPENHRRSCGSRLSSIPKMAMKSMLATPDFPKLASDTDRDSLPNEMIPVLTLLASHGNRIYEEGYFMILAELNNEGEPIHDRKWTEVFGTLQGTVITMWDAAQLDSGKYETTFINIADGYMRSMESLSQDLQNVIVLSTTMKNRFLLQFETKKLFSEWTAALRLAAFERTSLQEAYTGALLSSKGSQLHGIRAMLMESRYKTELWCNVRFGVGMPWKRVWMVITPHSAIKEKKDRKKRGTLGKIELFSDPKHKKKRPLAVVHEAFTAFAVFPEKAVLVNVSSLIKLECYVEFDGDTEVRESSIFMIPEQHPGVQGFETLIRTLIPIYDVYELYGRPKRLNADKNDLNSLLFGMPSLPRAYYLDVIDVFMLTALPDSASWATNDWNSRLKELIASKMATGFKGSGDIHQMRSASFLEKESTPSKSSKLNVPAARPDRQRAVSDPNGPQLFSAKSTGSTALVDANISSASVNKFAPAVPSPLQNSPLQHSRPAPKAPSPRVPGSPSAAVLAAGAPNLDTRNKCPNFGVVRIGGTPPVTNNNKFLTHGAALNGPRAFPGSKTHNRVKSEGERVEAGLLSPHLADLQNGFKADPVDNEQNKTQQTRSNVTSTSKEPFILASDTLEPSSIQKNNKANLFDPTYRPDHRSYADYSEYMHQYLQNMSMKDGSGKDHPAPSTAGSNSSAGGAGAITTTIEVSDESDDDGFELNQYKKPESPLTEDYIVSRERAKLLSTPVKNPAISEYNLGSADSAIKLEQSPPQSTALNAPRVAIYPNAPGSPLSNRMGDYFEKPSSGSGTNLTDQRRPSGPRPMPSSFSSPSKSSQAPVRPVAIGTSHKENSGPTAQVAHASPYTRPSHSSESARSTPGVSAQQQAPQGYPAKQNTPQSCLQPQKHQTHPRAQYFQTQHPQTQYPQAQYPQAQYPQAQFPQAQYLQSQYPQAQYQAAAPQCYPQGQFQQRFPKVAPQGYPQGYPQCHQAPYGQKSTQISQHPRHAPNIANGATNGATNGAPNGHGVQSYGLRAHANYSSSQPQMQPNLMQPGHIPQQVVPAQKNSGNAKTGPVLRPLNEIRAEQAMRAKAMNNGSDGP